jgi:hypothetical protein
MNRRKSLLGRTKLPKADTTAPKPPQPRSPSSLLVPRKEGARLLSRSTDSMRRLEQAGLLRPVRLDPGASAHVYYRKSDILRLVNGGVGDVE